MYVGVCMYMCVQMCVCVRMYVCVHAHTREREIVGSHQLPAYRYSGFDIAVEGDYNRLITTYLFAIVMYHMHVCTGLRQLY